MASVLRLTTVLYAARDGGARGRDRGWTITETLVRSESRSFACVIETDDITSASSSMPHRRRLSRHPTPTPAGSSRLRSRGSKSNTMHLREVGSLPSVRSRRNPPRTSPQPLSRRCSSAVRPQSSTACTAPRAQTTRQRVLAASCRQLRRTGDVSRAQQLVLHGHQTGRRGRLRPLTRGCGAGTRLAATMRPGSRAGARLLLLVLAGTEE